jgi:hypothetical protein
MQANQIGIPMENIFGAELRLTAEETQSLLTGFLAVGLAFAVFAVVMALQALS